MQGISLKDLSAKRSLVLYELYKRKSLEWLSKACFTFDEHDKHNSVKPFPVRPYVSVIIDQWENSSILHIAKSRQMSISWLAVALLLHEAQFYGHRLQAIFSKKKEDAQALVERAKFIYNKQPLWLKNMCPLDRKMRDMPYGNLFFVNGSKIVGLAQGADQIRSYVPSTAVIDEAAFQDELENTYAACVPCCERIITISSAGPGFFQRLTEL